MRPPSPVVMPSGSAAFLDALDFVKGGGLLPVVVVDVVAGDVLMVAWANRQAVTHTLADGSAWFFSRSRGELWRKGETSGAVLPVLAVEHDCDADTLRYLVEFPVGAACHTGTRTCFAAGARAVPATSAAIAREPSLWTADPIHRLAARLWAAYEYLLVTDLTAESGTSRRLRAPNHAVLDQRLREELGELAGVLSGEHGRTGRLIDDLTEEASQVWYWATVRNLATGARFAGLRPDRAGRAGFGAPPVDARAFAARVAADETLAEPSAAYRRAGEACALGGVPLARPLLADLADLASRPYLAPHFAPGE